jgi:hypothetical protein
MKTLTLLTFEDTPQGLIGVLLIDGHYVCDTLEPGMKSRWRIPAGIYDVKKFKGKKYSDTYEIIVAGHTAVLFHWGNTDEHTDGCVLVGRRTGKLGLVRAVLHSRVAFDEDFIPAMGNANKAILQIIRMDLGNKGG